MEQFPFAVDNSDSLSPIVAAAAGGDDASSLLTASSQGSFVPTTEDDNGGMMHSSSSQQHTDEDEIDRLNNDAVFANLTTAPSIAAVQQPKLLPVEPIIFGATIVDLPPPSPNSLPSSHRATAYPSTTSSLPPVMSHTSMAPSLLSGVDVLKSAGSRVTSVLSNFGYNLGINSGSNNTATAPTIRISNTTTSAPPVIIVSKQHYEPPPDTTVATTSSKIVAPDEGTNDFAYINVTDEDEVDVWLDENHANAYHDDVTLYGSTKDDSDAFRCGNILAVLLANDTLPPHLTTDDTPPPSFGEQLVQLTEHANTMTAQAVIGRKNGNLQTALDRHSDAAKLYHQAALHIREKDESLAISLLLLSQTQAKAALSLKRIIKLRPNAMSSVFPTNNHRLRARVRGALRTTPEADISASTFMGKASKSQMGHQILPQSSAATGEETESDTRADENSKNHSNLVDEMMELERELRDMDMTLALGNSIATLDARTQNRMKSSVSESFMVVPGSGSFMSTNSSMILGPAPISTSRPYNPNIGGTAGVRARANRLQNVTRPSHASTPQHPPSLLPPPRHQAHLGLPSTPYSLESSWWGNASMASQVLSASVISLAPGSSQQQHQEQSASTKQLMRLMDSLRTLGEENATLLREVEDAEAARLEAKTAREQMKRFKEEYSKRFVALKEALEKFRKGYPGDTSMTGEPNPVTSSTFSRTASTSDQIQRQEQLIRKLTADLKKEKEESKRKDGALRKYESFYREVKARSAQKAAQKQNQVITPQPNRSKSYRGYMK